MRRPSLAAIALAVLLAGCGGTDPVRPPGETLTIATRTLPAAPVGSAYSQRLEASGGAGGYSWSLTSGALPHGIALAADGSLTGTPDVAGASTFTVRATSGSASGTRTLRLTIQPAACAVAAQPPAPAPASSWTWTLVATPLGSTTTEWVAVDPEDALTWYAGGEQGLYVSHDGGTTWTSPVATRAQVAAEFATGDACTAYVANGPRLLRTMDRGRTWDTLFTAPAGGIRSVHPGRSRPGLLLVGVQIDPNLERVPDRIYRSADDGRTWTTQPIDGGSRGLIPWDIEEDADGVIYAGTEIYDHPQPYHPPFWSSSDGGLTWHDATGQLGWHVVSIQAHPNDGSLYALTEGAGLWSKVAGDGAWTLRSQSFPYPELLIRIDPLAPTRLYGGMVHYQNWPGGAYATVDGGRTWHAAGLDGLTVSGLSLAQQGRVLVAAAYGSGIWRAVVPASP